LELPYIINLFIKSSTSFSGCIASSTCCCST